MVTGAARGIGRAIAVELAANGADVIALDIAGPVSTASNALPASPAELEDTVRQIHGYGRRGEAVQADIRDIAALRAVADAIGAACSPLPSHSSPHYALLQRQHDGGLPRLVADYLAAYSRAVRPASPVPVAVG